MHLPHRVALCPETINRQSGRTRQTYRGHELEGKHNVRIVAGDHKHVDVIVSQVHESAGTQGPDGCLDTGSLLVVEYLSPEVFGHVSPVQAM